MRAALLVAVSLYSAVSFAEPSVEDDGKFFSVDAVSKAERLISEVYTKTRKQIFVKTVNALPNGQMASHEAEKLFQNRRINGLLIYLSRKPQQIVVTVGRETEKRYSGKDQIKNAMIPFLKKRDFDNALRAGLTEARSGLVAAFSPQVVTLPPRPEPEESPIPWMLILGGAAVLIFILFAAFRGARGGMRGRQPGYYNNEGNYYDGGSGGFGRGFFGGILGSLTGNWLYDRMSDRHSNTNYDNNSSSSSSYSGNDSYRSDDGNVGSSSSDSWGSSSDSTYDSGGGSSYDSGSSDSGSSSSSDSW